MNERPFIRTIVYLSLIAVLLIPLGMLSQPAAGPAGGGPVAGRSTGGTLAQLRDKYQLNQANLGEIDPTSETIRLATLGLRGVASNMLWQRAVGFQKTENWTALEATLDQITKLEPNFIAVWRYQAWNQAYNVSVEFDDYRDRYAWVMKGLNFLQKGIQYNDRDPRLRHDMGWMTSHKIGTADEKKQFRPMFAKDEDFNLPTGLPRSEWDNWLVGRYFLKQGEELIDTGKARLVGMSDLIYYQTSPLCLLHYAESLQEDGIFGERMREAWRRGAEAWREYGDLDMVAQGVPIRLNDLERHQQRIQQLSDEINKLAPDMKAKIEAERKAALTPEELEAMAKPENQRTPKEENVAYHAGLKLFVTPVDVAGRIEGDNKAQADKIMEEVALLAEKIKWIDSYRNISNRRYWQRRAELCQKTEAIDGSRLLYEAHRAATEDGDIGLASEKFAEGFAIWEKLIDEYKDIILQKDIGDELADRVEQYEQVLKQQDKELPKDFKMRAVLDLPGWTD